MVGDEIVPQTELLEIFHVQEGMGAGGDVAVVDAAAVEIQPREGTFLGEGMEEGLEGAAVQQVVGKI